MGVVDLKALARERRLRGYSRLRKAELIALLHPAPDELLEPGELTVNCNQRTQSTRDPSTRKL